MLNSLDKVEPKVTTLPISAPSPSCACHLKRDENGPIIPFKDASWTKFVALLDFEHSSMTQPSPHSSSN